MVQSSARSALTRLVLGGITALAAWSCDDGSNGTGTTTSATAGAGGATASGGGGSGAATGSTTPSASAGAGGSGGAPTTSTTTNGTGGSGAGCTELAQRHGGDTPDDAAQIAAAVVDAPGGVIAGGEIGGTVKVGAQTLTSAGGADALVVRLAESGAIAWVKRWGAVYDDRVKAVAAMPGGGAVVVGTFDGVVDFGGMSLTSIAGPDAFVARLDGAGQLVFVTAFVNADARAVAIDPGGDILVAGDFTGTTSFGNVELTSSQSDVFVARLDAAGTVVAAKGYAFPAKPGALAIAAGAHIYLAGSFQGTIDLGLGPITSAGSKDVMVARLDPSLDVTVQRSFGDDTSQEARAVAVMPDGSAAIAGSFRGAMVLDGATLVADTQDDAFVARLDPAGNVVFARRFGDAAEQIARAIAAPSSGGLLVAGGFHGTIDAGDGPLTSAEGEDVFLAQLDDSGNAVKTQRWGGAANQRARAVSADPCGAVVVAGDFTGTLPWSGDVLQASGSLDGFIARVAP